jgi:hypothetical protein
MRCGPGSQPPATGGSRALKQRQGEPRSWLASPTGRSKPLLDHRSSEPRNNLERSLSTSSPGRARPSISPLQELGSEPIAQAILDARWRGVSVNLFLEQDYLRTPLKSTEGVPLPPTPKAGETADDALRRVQWGADETALADNRKILAALLRSDVEVKGDFNPKSFHQKFALRDYRNGKATKPGRPALLSGSAKNSAQEETTEAPWTWMREED